jgi:hypothetical protein
VDLVAIGEELVKWLLTGKARRSAEINSYIRQLQNACRQLVEIDNPTSDKASLLHEQLKVMYKTASAKLPPHFIEAEGWNLYRALSSARIYYWLRVVSAKSEDELQELFNDRKNMSSSFEILSKMLFDATDDASKKVKIEKLNIEQVRKICLNDIAKLIALRPFSC